MALRLTLLLVLFGALVCFLFGRQTLLGLLGWRRTSRVDKASAKLMASEGDHETFIKDIPVVAERHREQMNRSFKESLDYRKSDLARVDAIIRKAWGKELPKNLDTLILTFGCYFGETIRKLRGGEWAYDPNRGYCLREVGGAATVYPFEKVKKRFQNSDHDSLALFYTALVKALENSA